MTTFSDSVAPLLDHDGSQQRRSLWEAFARVGLPTTDDEVWRYAPLGDFHLDDFAGRAAQLEVAGVGDWQQVIASATVLLTLTDGRLTSAPTLVDGVTLDERAPGTCLGDEDFANRYGDDAFALLNGALAPAVLEVGIEREIPGLIVVVNEVVGSNSFASLRLKLAPGARATVIDLHVGGSRALVAPLTEISVRPGARLSYLAYQRLEPSAWHVGRTTALIERDATLFQSVIGLGGLYDRSRNDARLLGTGATSELRTTFLGVGDQVHDFRTHQRHIAPRTTARLLSKGALADRSRSVYTGLIEIERGAKRADARQTNVNLLLSPQAHADAVPNLDIKENDVACAHASSVGPLDEMAVWYLGSRGVDPRTAERLMVQGFFNEMTEAMPVEVARLVEGDVSRVIATTGLVA